MSDSVYVICYDSLTIFPNRKIAIGYFLDGMTFSEGSERERYANIYFGLVSTEDKMVSDGDGGVDPIIRSYSEYVDGRQVEKKLPHSMRYSEFLNYIEDVK